MADKKPNLMVAIGIGKKPGGASEPPPKYPSNPAQTGEKPPTDGPPPPPAGLGGEGPEEDEAGEKITPERAGYGGPEETCANCENFTEPNQCSKVDTMVDPGGRCYAMFEPKAGGGTPAGPGGMPMMPLGGEEAAGGIQ